MRSLYLVKTVDGVTRFIELDLKAKARESVAPAVHGDYMRPLRHPITGQYFDSKSAFREVTREHGYVEAGQIIEPAPASELEGLPPEIENKIDEVMYKWKTPSAKEQLIQKYQRQREENPPVESLEKDFQAFQSKITTS